MNLPTDTSVGEGPQAGDSFVMGGLGRTSLLCLGAAALVSIYAALELRPLFADGFYYFLRILERETFMLSAPARRTVEFIRQLPLLAALRLDIGDVRALALIFTLSLQLMPLVFVGLCWTALPRTRKSFFVFPLLHYFLGTMGATFDAITEGAMAAAYFWLLLFLILFRAARPAGRVLTAVLALGVVVLHEGMALLAPLLAAASLWRVWRAESRAGRMAFGGYVVWFLAVAGLQLNYVVEPSNLDNRTAFFRQLFQLWWMRAPWESINFPAVFGLVASALLSILLVHRLTLRMTHGRAPNSADAIPRGSHGVAWSRSDAIAEIAFHFFGVISLGTVVTAIALDEMFAAIGQMSARNQPLLVSLPLAMVALWAAVQYRITALLPFREGMIVCAWLAAANGLYHADSVRRWSDYVGTFREVLSRNRGIVVWEGLMAQLEPSRRRLFERFSFAWAVPTSSIILTPGGQIATIITVPRSWTGWRPFDPGEPSQLPRSRFWTYDAYFAALRLQR